MSSAPASNGRPAARTSEPTAGMFRIVTATGQLTWSDELFRIYGFAPGEVHPTLSLMVTHQHHEDRNLWTQALRDATRASGPIARWHRIVTAARRDRNLVTVLRPFKEQGRVVGIEGSTVDITDQIRQDRADEVTRAVVRAAETRGVIDQAKGVLMATLDLDEDRSFELLRWYSSYANVKVRNIASALVERLSETHGSATPPHQRIAELLAEMSGHAPVFPDIAELTEVVAVESTAKEPSHIPVGLLPRTLVRAVTEASVSISIADYLAPDYPLVFVNPAFEKLTGYAAADILGRNCRFLQDEETDPRQIAAIRTALHAGRDVRAVMHNVRRDGTGFWNEIHLSPVRDTEGRLTHYIGYQTDASERVIRQQQLERLAYSDAATGLPNEAALERHIRRRIESPGGPKNLCLTVIELLYWPSDNGHDQPEDPEQQFEALVRIREAFGSDAYLARLGAGQLAAVTDLPVDLARLQQQFQSAGDEQTVPLGVRVGTAEYPSGGRSAHSLMMAAHQALKPL